MAGIFQEDTGMVMRERKMPDVQEDIPGAESGLVEEKVSSLSGVKFMKSIRKGGVERAQAEPLRANS